MKNPSKISLALAYLKDHPEATRYEAAKHANLTPSSLYRRLKVIDAQKAGRCPACGLGNPG